MTVLCFDLDGTLVTLTRPYEEILDEVFERHLGSTERSFVETYDEAFYEAFSALETDPVHVGMTAVLASASEEATSATAAEDLVTALQTAEFEAGRVSDAARRSLARLGDDNDLAVVTNGMADWQRAKLAHHDLLDVFDAVVTSYEAGAHKPDPAIFQVVRERLPADDGEYVMVGDDYKADVEGARAAGFVPIHFEDDGPDFWQTLDVLV